MTETTLPDIEALRQEALVAGALDPISLRFRIMEFDKLSDELLGIPYDDIGFRDAVETAADLIESRSTSYFCLQPVGFVH
jgi:hypothetical protein